MALRYAAKVFGYVDKPLKARAKRLREMDGRLTESRLVDEGLRERVEFYESQLRPSQPAQESPAKRRRAV